MSENNKKVMAEADDRAKLEALKTSLGKIEAEVQAAKRILRGYRCQDCAHWLNDACAKGYNSAGKIVCREFLSRSIQQ